jgi:ABC-type dipeptide/oligopeptide/nickel transport system permease component
MTRLIGRRLLFIVPALLLVSILVFLMEEVVPGDIGREILGPYASAEAVARLDHQKVELGIRSRPQYRLSIFGVPIIFAIVGALIGGAIAH